MDHTPFLLYIISLGKHQPQPLEINMKLPKINHSSTSSRTSSTIGIDSGKNISKAKPDKTCPGASYAARYPMPQLASQRMAADVAWEAREAQPQLAGEGRGADDVLLAALELVDVPGGEDELAVEELGLGRRGPDQEVRGKGD